MKNFLGYTGLLSFFALMGTMASASPVLHWALEEGSGVYTEESVSATTNVAQLIGGEQHISWTTNGLAPDSQFSAAFTKWTGSRIDAGTVDGGGVYVPSTPAPAAYSSLGTEFTISAWFQTKSQSISDQIIMSSDFVNPGGWLFGIQNGEVFFDFKSSRWKTGLTIVKGNTYFVVLRVDGSARQMTLWDGQSWQEAYGTGGFNPQLVGLEIGGFNNGTRPFNGSIDEVRIYDEALDDVAVIGLSLANAVEGPLVGAVFAGTNLTAESSVDFTIQFTEDVTNFTLADLVFTTLGNTIISGPILFSGTGSVYSATVPVSGDGTLSADFSPLPAVVTLDDGAPLIYTVGSDAIELDQTGPILTISLDVPNPTGSPTIDFLLSFNEPVSGVTLIDLEIQNFGLSIGGTNLSGAASNYSVRFTDVFGEGTLSIALDPLNSITDLVGNPVQALLPTVVLQHIIDSTPPYVVAIVPQTNWVEYGSSALIEVQFSEAVSGFNDTADLTVSTNHLETPSFWSFNPSEEEGTAYSFYVRANVVSNQISGELWLDISTNGGIIDLAGNPLIVSNAAPAHLYFKTSPVQEWFVTQGLTNAEIDTLLFEDPDGDQKNNLFEFLRGTDPNSAGASHVLIQTVEVDGQHYGTVTFAVLDAVEFEESGSDNFYAELSDVGVEGVDLLSAGTNLNTLGNGDTQIMEEIEPALDFETLPPLPEGWSWRQFRFTEPTDELPVGFFKLDLFLFD